MAQTVVPDISLVNPDQISSPDDAQNNLPWELQCAVTMARPAELITCFTDILDMPYLSVTSRPQPDQPAELMCLAHSMDAWHLASSETRAAS